MSKSNREFVSNQPLETFEVYSLLEATDWGRKHRLKLEHSIFNYVSRYVEDGAKILEVGSGRGEFGELVREKGFRYVGIEPSAGMRISLLERGFEILGEPVPPISLKDESVHWVHSVAVIEHLDNYMTAVEFFRESWRVLKQGGVMSSVVPNCDTIGMIFYLQDYQHNFVTNRGRLEHLARDTGFEIIDSQCFLTSMGLTSFAFLDRIFAHILLLFARSPIIYSLVRLLTGDILSYRIYKHLFDQTIFIARKSRRSSI